MWKPVSLVFFLTFLVVSLVHAQPTVEKAKKALQAKNEPTAVAKAETLPPTLPANMFTGNVRQAYEVAAEIPEVLAELNCHCGCDKSRGHANLLHCFADTHAAGCQLCVNEALDAHSLFMMGTPPDQIHDFIEKKYGPQ